MLQLNFLVLCLFVSLLIFDQTIALPTNLGSHASDRGSFTPTTMTLDRRNQHDNTPQSLENTLAGGQGNQMKKRDEQNQKTETQQGNDMKRRNEQNQKTETQQNQENSLKRRNEENQKTQTQQNQVQAMEKRHHEEDPENPGGGGH
ncbi:hypothetical protein DFH28DRAFT_17448 [Melampsora americana]|nr:hypothetical protein DFH28DRAFT_17448 [Melampsora americana]